MVVCSGGGVRRWSWWLPWRGVWKLGGMVGLVRVDARRGYVERKLCFDCLSWQAATTPRGVVSLFEDAVETWCSPSARATPGETLDLSGSGDDGTLRHAPPWGA